MVDPKFSSTFIQRFWKKVEIYDCQECWPWKSKPGKRGYGQIFSGTGFGPIGAHVASYMINVGPIPKGLHVCHTCDNKLCVNPKHLWLGTNAQNHEDKDRKGRHGYTGVLGERHPRATLTDAVVIQIKREIAARPGDRTLFREMRDRFGVSKAVFYNIRGGGSWRHL